MSYVIEIQFRVFERGNPSKDIVQKKQYSVEALHRFHIGGMGLEMAAQHDAEKFWESVVMLGVLD